MVLTTAQKSGMAYFAALTLGRDEKRRALASLSHPDPRTIEALLKKGLIQVVGHNYGPLYGLTAAGRQTLETGGEVEAALERWRNPPPMTEEQKRLARALEESADELDEDDD